MALVVEVTRGVRLVEGKVASLNNRYQVLIQSYSNY